MYLSSSSGSLAHWLELVVRIRLNISVLAPLVLAFLLDEHYPPHSQYLYTERSLLQARSRQGARCWPIWRSLARQQVQYWAPLLMFLHQLFQGAL